MAPRRPDRPDRPTDRPLPPEQRTTLQPGPARGQQAPQLPVVIASTCDPGGLQRLSLRLYGRAEVRPVRDTRELTRQAKRHPGCVIVLDAAAPELDPLDAAHALEVVGTRAVIVWGASPMMREELAGGMVTATWMHVGNDTQPHELAELISSML